MTLPASHSLTEVAARTGIDCNRRSWPATMRCPFPTHGHFDRSPSLYLHPDSGLFFCFGCVVMGDSSSGRRVAKESDGVRPSISSTAAGR
jgi:hypothetical protein